MAMQYRQPLKTESRGDQFHKMMAESRQSNASWRLSAQGSHRDRVAVAVNVVEQLEIRVYVHHQPESGNPFADRHADVY